MYSDSLSDTLYLFPANLTVAENSAARAGLMSDLSLCCDGCDQSTRMQTSINITQRESYDVNRRAVYHALESGSGYKGLASFCGVMNMPCLSLSAYHNQVDTILDGLEDVTKEELVNADQRLRKLLIEENGESDSTTVLDAAVSFDGTWAKRGFTSFTGVVFVISVDTGEVLDYHVLSKACQKCALKKTQCEGDDDQFEEWRTEHLASGECDINFTGSSPAMEAEGAEILWKRSIHNIRYKWMVSDGDSKAFNSVENVYDGC